MLEVGQKAPDFIAPAVRNGAGEILEFFSVFDDHDAVVLVFQPADYVPTGTAELCALRDAGWADVPGLAVVGVTGDSLFSHAAYADRFDLAFPLVSDFHGSVADSYDLRLESWEGHSHIPGRGTVVIDGDWTVTAIETDEPLAESDPAPIVRATDAMSDLGFDVSRPTVDYAQFAGV